MSSPDAPRSTSGPQTTSEALPAEFGVGTAALVVVASMVGVGILTTSGYTVEAVGSNSLMLALWVVGGLAALSAALTLAELSAALPRAGGDYIILYEAYGPLAAFLSGWVTFFMGFAAPAAASASASASYLIAPLGLDGTTGWLAERGLATVGVLIFAAVHTSGRSRTVRVQVGMTALKLGLLALYIAAGLAAGWRNTANFNDFPALDLPTLKASAFSLVYISYAYFGWNAASYLAGEVSNPGRQLPRAIGFGTGAVVLLYLAMNVVYGLAMPASEVRAIARAEGFGALEPIAQLAAGRLFGAGWSKPLSVAVGLMLLSSLSAYVLAGPRVAYAMARAGQFPAIAGRLSRRFQTPAAATALMTGFALIILWSGSFHEIVTYASVGMAIFSILTIASVYILRWRQPNLPRPFRTPGYPVVPAVYIVVSIGLTVAAFVNQPKPAMISLATLVGGIVFYYVWRLERRITEIEAKLRDLDARLG